VLYDSNFKSVENQLTTCTVLADAHVQLCHQLSELVDSSKLMSSSLSQCLTVFIQQDQVYCCHSFCTRL